MNKLFMFAGVFCLCVSLFAADKGMSFENFADIRSWKAADSAPRPVQVDSAYGKGLLVSQPGSVSRSYKFRAGARKNWQDKFNGLSFKVKGDGSANWGVITVGTGAWSYSYFFPVDNRDFREYRVHFSDFQVANSSNGKPLNSPGALSVGGFELLRFGDRWKITHNNQRIARFTYTVADVRLINDAVPELKIGKYSHPSYKKQFEALKKGEKFNILCLGDSITAGTALKQPDSARYAAVLQKNLRAALKNRQISVVSKGVGGARLFDTLNWMKRDLSGTPPHLITLMIGYNNKSVAQPPEVFKQQLLMWVDRVIAHTEGKSAIILIPTLPGQEHRFAMQDDFAQAVREVAKERNLLCCPVDQAFKALGRDKISEYMADFAHPNAAGHRLFAKTLGDFIISQVR